MQTQLDNPSQAADKCQGQHSDKIKTVTQTMRCQRSHRCRRATYEIERQQPMKIRRWGQRWKQTTAREQIYKKKDDGKRLHVYTHKKR